MAIARQVGETVRLNAVITNIADNPADPAVLKIKINKPDGSEALAAADMEKSDVGVYYYDYLIPNDLGTYSWNAVATGSEARITIAKNIFSVNPAIGD